MPNYYNPFADENEIDIITASDGNMVEFKSAYNENIESMKIFV